MRKGIKKKLIRQIKICIDCKINTDTMKPDIQYKYPSINHYFCDNTECVSMVVKLMASVACIQKLLGNEVYVHDLCLNQIEKLETQVFCNIETEDLKILLKMFVGLMSDYAGDAEVLETRAKDASRPTGALRAP